MKPRAVATLVVAALSVLGSLALSVPAPVVGATEQLTGLDPACPDPVTDATQECWVVLTSADGMAIPALVIPPAPPARPTTLGIVYAHGAVQRSVGFAESDPSPGSRHWTFHQITDLGYWMIAPDYRGSNGHGAELEGALDWVGKDADDVEAAARFLRERMGVQRLVVMGSSGGAFIVGHGMIRHPEMAEGFAVIAGATDLYGVYPELSSEKQNMLVQSLGPYEAPHAEYYARSATHQVDRIARPVLIMHGSDDTAVSPAWDRAFAQALQGAGKTHEFHEYAGGHGFFWDPVTPFGEAHWVDFLGWVESVLSTDTAITEGPVGATTETSATFRFTGTNPASFECRLDAAAFAPCTSPTVLDPVPAGTHRFEVRSRTPDGIADPTPAAWSWSVVSDSAPDTVIDGGPPSTTTATTAQLTFHADRPGATFECRLDGAAWSACSSGVTYGGLALGSHSFEVRASEGGLTDPSPAGWSWTVEPPPPTDTVSPVSSFTSVPADPSTMPATFGFTSNEPGSTFKCRLVKNSLLGWTPCSSPYSFTSLPVGAYTFSVRATDPAGNIEANPPTYRWQVVATPPTPGAPDTFIDGGPVGVVSDPVATFAFHSDVAGATFDCRVDGGTFGPCTSPWTTPALAPGPHTAEVRASSEGTSDPTPATWSWTVAAPGTDTVPPETTIDSGPRNGTATSATFGFSSNEPGSTFQCRTKRVTWTAWEGCASPVTLSGLVPGGYRFEVRATDPAGNPDPTPAAWIWKVKASAQQL